MTSKRVVQIAIGLLAVLAVVVLLLALTPLLDDDLSASPNPAADYDDAMVRAAQLQAADGADVDPRCTTRVLSHGQRAAQSVVLLHGYTNCPMQFDAVAKAYYDAGYNVVVPRLPGHGLSDRMTKALSDITPADLTSTADNAVDIADGLGERVTVVGLSAGGTLAGWLAAQRDDVSEAVLVAALMVPRVLPEITVGPVARLGGLLPDYYLWWDGKQKEQLASPPYAYPRFSIHSLAALLAVGRKAQQSTPRDTDLQRLVVITNDNDAAVRNAAVMRLADRLGNRAAQRQDHVFAEELGYRHDLIDPAGENAEDLPAIYATIGPLLGLSDLPQALGSMP